MARVGLGLLGRCVSQLPPDKFDLFFGDCFTLVNIFCHLHGYHFPDSLQVYAPCLACLKVQEGKGILANYRYNGIQNEI